MTKLFEHVRFCIIGAGPTGLSFGRELMRSGIDSFVILEAESMPGGLCRSSIVDGYPLDIGGGHFLDVTRQPVLDFLFELMPESEWNRFLRVARIRIRNQEIDHPIESNIWQLPIDDQVDFLMSITEAGCLKGVHEPEKFNEWIKWKLGDRISEEYMIPYNEKIWSVPIRDIGTYWLHKLPSVSFRETLKSCLKKQPQGVLSAHGEFYYPKRHGYGEVWRRMGQEMGDRLRLGSPVKSIDANFKIINESIKTELIVNTIPWDTWLKVGAIPRDLEFEVRQLKFASIDVDYLPDNIDSSAHWIYEPSQNIAYHRLLLRHNFAANSHGHWTETNTIRSRDASGFRHRNIFAYPINTIYKPTAIDKILSWCKNNNILSIGRWGLWEHMNSDVAVQKAIEAARYAAKKL